MYKTLPEADRVPVLGANVFEKFRRLAYDNFGLHLTAAKHPLVAARLTTIAEQLHAMIANRK